MRICSFLPSATEILYQLGLGDHIVGVTYACDYPDDARRKPGVVRSKLEKGLTPAEIDREVSARRARGESLYEIDTELLATLAPDLIITQDLCQVCASSPNDLGPALECLAIQPLVLCLNPHSLADVWKEVRLIGSATGRRAEADQLASDLEAAVRDTSARVKDLRRPTVACLEWLDPPFIGKHWVPEMVECAGGIDALGQAGQPSFRTTWDNIFAADPEYIILMPCGYTLASVIAEAERLSRFPRWSQLKALRMDNVFAVHATGYFSRPSPRLADGVQLLASLLHPDSVRSPLFGDAVRVSHLPSIRSA